MKELKNIFVPKPKPKTIKFRSAEQKYHLISIFTENDGVYKTTEHGLINLIVESGMNLQNLWTYNDSPLRDDDPAFDVFTEIEHDLKEFLDNNFELVCQSYLNQFNNKMETKTDISGLVNKINSNNKVIEIFQLTSHIPDSIFHHNNEIGVVAVYAFHGDGKKGYKYFWEASYKRRPEDVQLMIDSLTSYIKENEESEAK